MFLRHRLQRRLGVAAVEFAFVLPVLVTLMAGLWEIGRLIQLQQILSNAARDGARIAAQSQTINSSGSPTLIQVDVGNPNVKQTVYNYLREANLNVSLSDIIVEFAFVDGDTTKTQPYQGVKNQKFKVTVRIPITSLEWTPLKLTNVTQLTATVYWTCLVDDPFTLDATLPNW